MLTRIYKIGLLLTGGVLYSAGAVAQNSNPGSSFEYIKNQSAWLTSENAAGLNNLSIKEASLAEVYFNKNNGLFIDYYQSDNSYSLGALCESFLRHNEKTVFYGKVDYTNFAGKHMGGSAFYDPSYHPFDIVEYADSTAGTKKMETYLLTGAISTIVSPKFVVGAKIDYVATSYFKTKDLRHTNDLMDMKITAGLRYLFSKRLDAGINYYYRRSTEGITFQSMGNTDQQFNSLISFGSFLGRQERFGESGYTTENSNTPFFNEFHGVSFQLELWPKNRVRFFNELGIKWRNGYFGKHASTSVLFTEHKSTTFNYRGVLSFTKNTSVHQLELKLEEENLKNFENAYRKETSSGGNSTIVYYGKTQMLKRKKILASAEYTGTLHVKNTIPVWVLQANANFFERDQTVSVYPSYRKQTIHQLQFGVFVQRNSICKANMYSIYLGGNYIAGGGIPNKDGIYNSSSTSSKNPAVSLDRYLFREYEYLTASRITPTTGFRYTRFLHSNHTSLYSDLSCRFTKAFSVSYLGTTMQTITLAVGCTF